MVTEKKERVFYLDFIRALATVIIIMTHYNALYLYLPQPTPEKAFITTKIAGIYIGSFGVSLFFIISGAALMYIYGENIDYKLFYKKRFLSIFPMFWIAFVLDFLIVAYLDGGINPTIPKYKIIYSIIGMDHYLTEFTISYARIGEWFLGCIILIYILFPLLRFFVVKYPRIFAIVALAVYFLLIYVDNGFFPLSKNVFVRIPEFAFGMYFVKYFKKFPKYMCAISVVVLIVNGIFEPDFINNSIQTSYVGILSFIVCWFLSKLVECQPVRYISGVISKYSYSIFLVHHVIIMRVMSKFDLININRTNSYLMFFFCLILIGFVSKFLYEINSKVKEYWSIMFS